MKNSLRIEDVFKHFKIHLNSLKKEMKNDKM